MVRRDPPGGVGRRARLAGWCGVTAVAAGRLRMTAIIESRPSMTTHRPDGGSWVMAAESGIRVVGTALTGRAAGRPGSRAHVVLLDIDLGDGTTVERNVAAILGAGPAVLVLSAADKPLPGPGRDARRGSGYVLKSRETARVRAAHQAVAAGQDWISPRLGVHPCHR